MTVDRLYEILIHLIDELHKEALRYQGYNNCTLIMSITVDEYCQLKNEFRNSYCICKDWEKFFKVISN